MPAALFSTRTNLGALRAHRQIVLNNARSFKSEERLSSGRRINSAADDVAGLAVSTKLRAQLSGFNRALRNTHEALALLQTAEGAYESVELDLMRMRELAIQAATDSYSADERGLMQNEFAARQGNIDRVSAVTEYNDIKLLDGSAGANADGTLTFQVGAMGATHDRISIQLEVVTTGATSLNVAQSTLNVQSIANARAALDQIDTALDALATKRTKIGSTLNQLSKAASNLGHTIQNTTAGESHTRDVDMGRESVSYASAQVLQEAGISMITKSSKELGAVALQLLN